MAFSIALTIAQRDNLLSLQSTERNQATTQRRLASGREVNQVTDDVFRYFAARSLDSRARDFIEFRDIIDQGISALATTVSTLETLTKYFDQIRGVLQGSAGKNGTELLRLGETLLPTLQQVGDTLIDSHYQGVNLLRGSGPGDIIGALSIRFSERHTLDLTSFDIFALSGNAATESQGSVLVDTEYTLPVATRFLDITGNEAVVDLTHLLRYGTDATNVISSLAASSGRTSILSGIVDNINGVIRNLNIRAQELGTYIGLLQTRSDFNFAYATEHTKGVDKYTLADINQEGAYLVALQTRQQLGLNALAVSGRQQNAVLTLFT